MLQDELASIIGYFYSRQPIEFYTDRMPEDFFVPSMYFPLPVMSSGGDTLYGYKNTYQLFVKFFANRTPDALQAAGKIAESLKRKRFLIPLLSKEDGAATGRFVRLDAGMDIKELSEGIAQLSLKWRSRYPYEREVYEKMGKLYLTVNMKKRGKEHG